MPPRLYTTWAFLLLNIPLRDLERFRRGEAHPLPITLAFLAEGIGKLRAVGAKLPNAHRQVRHPPSSVHRHAQERQHSSR